ncbi:hypothetical protein DYI37_03100 [Fulvimarina endophytica]|uniref:Phage tail assembly protein n=1 Tax=Fulvimarina endophytica TaxID=2293836 RepID=A0A371XB29_9HYPH|nr:hypothetical protein [Fulvimarina endophytica]RFC66445.1 hypothetical protein DYI37_03100 [Fulvimarina endophytica]
MAEVNITLDGDEVALRCTPKAMKDLCTKHGSLVALQQRVSGLDFNAAADTVEAGIGTKQLAHLKLNRAQVEEKIYEAGLLELSSSLTRYILLLANGGKEDATGEYEAASEGNG